MRKQNQQGDLEKRIHGECDKLWHGLIGRTGLQRNDRLPRWDDYQGRRMYVPHFIYACKDIPDGELIGSCRGDGVISGDAEVYEDYIGIYTDEGVLHNIVIDTRVECASVQFDIEGTPFFFPIVNCITLEGGVPCVDPKTGQYCERQPKRALSVS